MTVGILAGKTAFVSGSGQNIGRAIALQLARMGCNVVVNGARDLAGCEETAARVAAAGGSALIAMGGILIYVMLRFTLKFSLGSISATVHDVLVILGFFSITRLEFDLNALAAVLAIMGYSLNDTIVILDRIRENFRTMRKADPVAVVNASLNQTLSRTINTSLLTLLAVLSLLFFGGEMIHGFALAMTIGILVGVYSSIYIASAMVLAVLQAMQIRRG